MSDSSLSQAVALRQGLTFSQAEGASPLPQQLELRQISKSLIAEVWALIYKTFESNKVGAYPRLGDPWVTIMKQWWVEAQHRAIDEYPERHHLIVAVAKAELWSGNYLRFFDFIQFFIRQPRCPDRFVAAIEEILSKQRCAYRIVDRTVVPITSDAQLQSVRTAIESAKSASSAGPSSHLTSAMEALSNGSWAGSVRESIHAVESAARIFEPSATTLKPALIALERRGRVHPALKSALEKLYGYASDEKGVRHALVFEGAADVTEDQALLMFGLCASFVQYLLSAQKT